MERIRKKTAVLLLAAVMFMTLGLFPASAAGGDDAEKNATVDFVLVLDCSGSLAATDPYHLCATACRMFLDMVPLENARIGIITFGYGGSAPFELKTLSVENPYDLGKVHLEFPLGQVSSAREKADIKQMIDRAANSAGDKTPGGTATLSAVDLLLSNGAADGSACVVLLTDGDFTADQSHYTDEDNALIAAAEASKHSWPIYTLQLNEGKIYGENSEETKRMKAIAAQSGVGEEGYLELTDFTQGSTDITKAFLTIFNRFMFGGDGNVEMKTADASGAVTHSVSIPALTSETTIVVSGRNVTGVDVINPEGTRRTVTADIDEQNIAAGVESGSYVCIKLICPAAGEWTVTSHGDPGGTAAVYDCSVKDLDLTLNTSLEDPDRVLSKNDRITFNSYFTYHGTELLSNAFYQEKQPALVAVNTLTGQKTEFSMQAGPNGYVLELSMDQIGSGAFELRARLDDDMFRNGSKYSSPVRLRTENLPVEITASELPELRGYIGGSFDQVDLMEYISNPDGDPLEYKLECVTDRNRVFDYEIDDGGYLHMDCGLTAGSFQVQLSVKDGDMETYLEFAPFTVTVEDRPFEFAAVADVELWADAYPWQDRQPADGEIPFDEYYYDPDMQPLQIRNPVFEGEGQVYAAEWDGHTLKISPAAKGDGAVVLTVSDGCGEQEVRFQIHVVSGKAVFWARNWIWFALVLAVFALVLFVIVFISKNTRVRGDWDIVLEDDSGRIEMKCVNIGTFLSVGRQKVFPVGDMLGEALRYADTTGGGADLAKRVPGYFAGNRSASKLQMKGIFHGTGFILQNISSNGQVKVSRDGYYNPKAKKVKIGGGTVVIEIRKASMGGSGILTVTMSVSGQLEDSAY